jgi:carotenoid cleavage dioxygenase
VIVVAPAKFDLDALLTGNGPPLGWHGDEPTRIAAIPRAGTSADVQWLETDPFWAYHFANAFEDGDDVIVDFSRFSHFSLGADDQPATGAVTRARLDLREKKVKVDLFDDRITEFPRIDDRLQTRMHRYFSVSGKSAGMPMGQFNVLVRVDTQTGALTEWDSGRKVFDEVVFAPAEGGDPEQGYYVAFRTDVDTLTSEWFVLRADDVAAGPVATVELPFRVPNGLHGNWFSPSALA